jgi:hypothetical protein
MGFANGINEERANEEARRIFLGESAIATFDEEGVLKENQV